MKSSMIKTTVREIRESLGRYMAILAIVALGVGFFVGLKVTRPAMLDTAGRDLEEKELYDLRLISTLGFDETDVEQAARGREGCRGRGLYRFPGSGGGRRGKGSARALHTPRAEPDGGDAGQEAQIRKRMYGGRPGLRP